MRSARVTQPESPWVGPRTAKKRESRVWQTKIAGAELEGFIDWTRVVDNESVEEKEMFTLITGFATRRHKRLAVLEGEATSSFGVK